MFLALTGVPLVIVAIIAFVIIIGLIITVHEAGHFFFAKKAGILCHEFSIGMGPAIYKKQFKETRFTIRAIPIGGYVSMADEGQTNNLLKEDMEIGLNLEGDMISEIILDDDKECNIRGKVVSFDVEGKDNAPLYITLNDGVNETYYEIKKDAFFVFEKGETLQIEPYERTFDSKPKWARFVVLIAGAMNNFLLALLLYIIISFSQGVANYSSSEIGSISKGYVAEEIGIEAGDVITSVDGVEVSSWTEFSKELNKTLKTTVSLTILRDNEEIKYDNIMLDTIINSIAVSNLGVDRSPKTFVDTDGLEHTGLVVGTESLTFKNSDDSDSINKGDIITKMQVTYNQKDKSEYKGTTQVYDLTSWDQLVQIFDEMSSANTIKFESYKLDDKGTDDTSDDTYTLVSLDTAKEIENYTDEVLTNQKVDKIKIMLGISASTHFSFFGCIGQAFSAFWSDFTLVFRTLKLLIAPSDVRQVGVSNLSSVVGIFGLVKQYVGAGILALMSLCAMLSVNIGIMNLLPIPALDGGRILFLLIEAVTKKKVPKKIENIITLVFFALFILLFLYVTYNDILRL